ncbi:hypothetical protein L6164_020463 [Bauhinia variegata]|uniref:Uncharacterized protein n=1 Tax=Bauhinia variegata TaxID=167791 RepID=A0ACB9MVG5_BAUVA|nr:hypothetical protein L6164_020463 [Bauhinia variegata]
MLMPNDIMPSATERSFSDDHLFQDSLSSGNSSKQIVVVMDDMTEFDRETLQRTLDNVVCCYSRVCCHSSCGHAMA